VAAARSTPPPDGEDHPVPGADLPHLVAAARSRRRQMAKISGRGH
jgi:hypothetical protein